MRALSATDAGRLAWGLPVALIAYLLVTQHTGYLELPYWFCLGAPAAAVLGAWLVSAGLRSGRPNGPAGKAALIAGGLVLAAVLLSIAMTIHLQPYHRTWVHTAIRAGLLAGGLGLIGLGALAGWRSRRAPGPVHVLFVLALAVMINTDLQLLAFGLLRDLSIYLRAGHAFLDGQTVYAMHTEAEIAHNSSLYPFVYPPVSIPLFAGLAALPLTVARGLWLAMCLGVSVVGLRAIGVRWRWLPIVLAWPPFVQGIYIGNSIVPAFAFFAVAPMIGALLVVPPIFKSQLGVTGLWLLIERRWRDLALAVGLGLALILVTLPLVGLASWGDWARQLSDFTKLLQEHPAIEGASLAYFLPAVLAGLIGVAAVLVSLTRQRSDGLAALGVASVAASPTLYLDGLTMALPAILRLRAPLLWLAFALGSTLAFQQGFWVAVGLGFAALWFPVLTHAEAPDPAYHPLGSLTRAWPVLAPQGGSVAEAGAPAGAPGRQPEAVAGAPGSRD